MRKSIRLRMAMILAIMLLSTIFLCWFVNKQFLGDYYETYKVDSLCSVYGTVQSALNEYQEEENYSELELKLDKLGADRNTTVRIFECYEAKTVLGVQVWVTPFYPADLTERDRIQIEEGISRLNQVRSAGKKPIITTNNYLVCKVKDSKTDVTYLELYGVLDDGKQIYVRTSFQAMTEAVDIANKFLGYVGIFVTLIGIIVMFFIAKSFTKPIENLNHIARKMARLEFNEEYEVKTQDEIGALGESINFLSKKLEQTISELKTANSKLQQDIKQKIEIDEMRKEFLSNVTHELKTPIALIQGYAEGLQDNISEDQESREFYCEVIIDEANKMNNMVKKLLSLNQIESGQDAIHFEHFDIVALIQGVLQSTEVLRQGKHVTVEFKETQSIYVWADEFMIEEVVTNYISNAINHVKEPNLIRILVQMEGELLRVTVFNTGDPIPNDELDKIWTKFYKVDKARTREYGGNGIGLSIVKAIMDNHNQTYGVENSKDGVSFYFTLDAKRS